MSSRRRSIVDRIRRFGVNLLCLLDNKRAVAEIEKLRLELECEQHMHLHWHQQATYLEAALIELQKRR